MARIVLTNALVKIGNVDLSSHVSSVTITRNWAEVDTTSFGDSGRTRQGGLEDSSIAIDFHQDYQAASVDATLSPLVGGTASFYITSQGTAVSATNPKYTGTVLLTEYTPLAGAVGDLSTVSVTWPVSGIVTRGTVV